MIDTEALRKKVIDLAIQGKLTEQLQGDGDAESLYAQIQEEKAKLFKEGKIKKDKEFPEIDIDEVPFEVPSNWKWCRLGEVYYVLMGQSPDGTNVGTDISGIEFHQGKIFFGDKYLNESEQKTSEFTRIAEKNSVLLCVRAPVGVVNITKRTICIGRGLCALKALADMEPYYLFYYLLSCRKSFENSGTGSTFNSITVDVVKNHLIPIPPLTEQKRIVEVLDYIFNQINIIDDLQAKYSNDLEVLKNKIIDAAIRGKLTEQLPSDGDAEDLYAQIQEEKAKLIKEGKIKKEKPLPEITEDEIPFEIPKNWKWIRLGDVARIYGGKRIPAGRNLITEDTGHKYIRVSDMKNGTVITDNLLFVPEDVYPTISRYIINKEDIYITVAGTIGKIGKIPPEIDGANLTENADRIVFSTINQDWMLWCLTASVIQKQIEKLTTQVAQPKLAIKRIQEFILPMPPLAEQKRITLAIDKTISLIS